MKNKDAIITIIKDCIQREQHRHSFHANRMVADLTEALSLLNESQSPTDEEKEEMALWVDSWRSLSSENINTLPEPIRKFIHDLETNCDPAGMVQENICLKENCEALQKKIEELEQPPKKVSREEIEKLAIFIQGEVKRGFVSKNHFIGYVKKVLGEAEAGVREI